MFLTLLHIASEPWSPNLSLHLSALCAPVRWLQKHLYDQMSPEVPRVVSVFCRIHALLSVGHQNKMPGAHILLRMSAQSKLIEYFNASVQE